MKPIRLQREAESEFIDAALHYEKQETGLGLDFIAAFEDARQRLGENPGRGQLIGYQDYRSLQLRAFPYRIVYSEISGTLWIWAVAHASRNPDYWKGRTAES